jgi:hypothetical protein
MGLLGIYAIWCIYIVTDHKTKKMKTNDIKEIKLGFSCQKQWLTMNGNSETRFCNSCSKTVYNFDNLSNEEVIEFFIKRSGQKTCGKFAKNQIESINNTLKHNSKSSILKPFITLGTALSIISCNTSKVACVSTQDHIKSRIEVVKSIVNTSKANLLKGKIVDEYQEPVFGASIHFKELNTEFTTDLDGNFEIEVSESDTATTNVTINYLGYEPFEIKLIDLKNKEVKIILVDSMDGHLGDSFIIEKPLHVKFWNKVKSIF